MTQLTGRTRRRLALGAAAAALAFSISIPALADDLTLDFDDLGYTFFGAGDSFQHKGLQLTAYSGLDQAQTGDLVGGLFDGRDPAMCMALLCPVDNNTPGYYAGLNDGVLVIGSGSVQSLHITSFDASFIGSFERAGWVHYYPEVAGLLEVRGYRADGSYLSEQFRLPGTGPSSGDFRMNHFETSAGFASQGFTEFAVFGYSCDFAGQCVAFENNAGQFALDNVNMQISAVPEPGNWMMLLGGFGTIAAFRRRRAV
jgi:hypothetical protein